MNYSILPALLAFGLLDHFDVGDFMELVYPKTEADCLYLFRLKKHTFTSLHFFGI